MTNQSKIIVAVACTLAGLSLIATSVTLGLVLGSKMNKNIFEPLPYSYVIKKEASKPGFADFYKTVEEARATVNPFLYSKLTYKKLYKFVSRYYSDSTFCKDLAYKAIVAHEQEWHAPVVNQLQAEKNRWEDYLLKHDVNRYLKVNVHKTYYDGSHPCVYFSYSEPMGKLKDASLSWYCKDTKSEWYTLYQIKDRNSPTRAWYWPRIYNSSFWSNHWPVLTVTSVTLADGTRITSQDLKSVPASIKDYIDNPSLENEERAIIDLINPNYQPRSTAVKAAIDGGLMMVDNLSFLFVNETHAFEGGSEAFTTAL